MFLNPKTWLLAKHVENDLRTSEGISHMLHPRTIRAVALYQAMNDGAPTGSVLMGLTTLSLMSVENLRQRGLHVPRQLLTATEALVALASEMDPTQ